MRGSDAALMPAWRQRVMPWLMALLRALVVWLLFWPAVHLLWAPPHVLVLPMLARVATLGCIALGTPLFLWPGRSWMGGILLGLAIGGYEWIWKNAALPGSGAPWAAVAIIALLSLGDGIGQLASRRLYRRAG